MVQAGTSASRDQMQGSKLQPSRYVSGLGQDRSALEDAKFDRAGKCTTTLAKDECVNSVLSGRSHIGSEASCYDHQTACLAAAGAP